METTEDLDFNSDDYNSFYYTSEKHMLKMDDEFLISKITERYPDLVKDQDENILKQVLVVIFNDSELIQYFNDEYDVSTTDLFKMLYRNFDFVFNKCFITKVQKTIKNKKYAKKVSNDTERKFRSSPMYIKQTRKRVRRARKCRKARKVL